MLHARKIFLHLHFVFGTRSLQSKFHTSAYVLTARRHSKTKGKNKSSLPHYPARKRLVSNLEPEGDAGTYEVARTEKGKTSARGPADRASNEKRKITGGASPPYEVPGIGHERQPVLDNRQGFVSGQERLKFDREEAPHTSRLPYERFRGTRRILRQGVDFRPNPTARRIPHWEEKEYGRGGLLRRGGMHTDQSEQSQTTRAPLSNELQTPHFEPLETLPTRFSSPPLMEGLLRSVHDVLGQKARPSPIQSLALKHLFTTPHDVQKTQLGNKDSVSNSVDPFPWPPKAWGQHLLAAETGSGKSFAYLLPMLQHLKITEDDPTPLPNAVVPSRPLPLSPRGLILAPTHELARQLTVFAKSLLHHMRLRVLCASRANIVRGSTARQLKRELDEASGVGSVGSVLNRNRPVDVLVGTTTRILEMARGLGWNRASRIEEDWDEERKERARQWVPGPPELGLTAVEWVVVDEADVLFDRDFEASTRLILADIARARGYSHSSFAALDSASENDALPASGPLDYPFHLSLVSATIPSSLASYLSVTHPKLTRLASPGLHRLPPTLSTEHQDYGVGNKRSDIEKRIRSVWADDIRRSAKTRSKILVFCNESSKVEALSVYLTEKGIPNIALTSKSSARSRGSNRHLVGFLKTKNDDLPSHSESSPASVHEPSHTEPHVLITTSLLSRGLDFSPQIRYVFIADVPRNMIDFLHRAGRAGRAGNAGRVVIFGKSRGRGSNEVREVRRRMRAVGG